ncbi:MAG: apolipoprotein N-acyltransferase [Thermoguttaceae bacterium]
MNALFIIAGFLFWYAALPPLGWWPLVVGAPACWTLLVRTPQVSGRDYLVAYFCAVAFWLANIYWVGYPHPATIIGCVAGACYLAAYFPLFLAIVRRAVHRGHFRPIVAMPVVWCGLEWMRYRFLGGFAFGALQHSLASQPLLIQTADIAGEYGVAMVVVIAGVGIGSLFLTQRHKGTKNFNAENAEGRKDTEDQISACSVFLRVPRSTLRASVPPCETLLATSVLVAALVYGTIRMREYDTAIADVATVNVAAVQGNFPCKLVNAGDIYAQTFTALTQEGRRAASAGAELVVLPETVCLLPLLEFSESFALAEWQDVTPEEKANKVAFARKNAREEIFAWANEIGVPVLTGLSAYCFENENDSPRRYNSAALIDGAREQIVRYDKRHLVMFGEYIPLADWMPAPLRDALQSICPSAEAGKEYVAMPLSLPARGTFLLSPNICYESTVPHFIRRQVATLRSEGRDAAILVNVSNDGWFLGSVQQDLHLATHIFRAVEHRKEYVTSTNGGFAAIIDAAGRLRAVGQRDETCFVMASVPTRTVMTSLYTDWGDTFAIACFLTTVCLGAFGLFSRIRARSVSECPNQSTKRKRSRMLCLRAILFFAQSRKEHKGHEED